MMDIPDYDPKVAALDKTFFMTISSLCNVILVPIWAQKPKLPTCLAPTGLSLAGQI
jgi:hypothetical protein